MVRQLGIRLLQGAACKGARLLLCLIQCWYNSLYAEWLATELYLLVAPGRLNNGLLLLLQGHCHPAHEFKRASVQIRVSYQRHTTEGKAQLKFFFSRVGRRGGAGQNLTALPKTTLAYFRGTVRWYHTVDIPTLGIKRGYSTSYSRGVCALVWRCARVYGLLSCCPSYVQIRLLLLKLYSHEPMFDIHEVGRLCWCCVR